MKPARLTQRFVRQLRSQYDYVRAENPAAAERVKQRVLAALSRLENFPESGSAWKRAGTREMVLPGLPYVIIYRVEETAVVVLALFHSARESHDVH